MLRFSFRSIVLPKHVCLWDLFSREMNAIFSFLRTLKSTKQRLAGVFVERSENTDRHFLVNNFLPSHKHTEPVAAGRICVGRSEDKGMLRWQQTPFTLSSSASRHRQLTMDATTLSTLCCSRCQKMEGVKIFPLGCAGWCCFPDRLARRSENVDHDGIL